MPMRYKLFHVTSTPRGPFERGTHCITKTDHGYFLAESSDDVLLDLQTLVHPVNLADRNIKVNHITRRVGDRNKMGLKLSEIRGQIEALSNSAEVIESWLEE